MNNPLNTYLILSNPEIKIQGTHIQISSLGTEILDMRNDIRETVAFVPSSIVVVKGEN